MFGDESSIDFGGRLKIESDPTSGEPRLISMNRGVDIQGDALALKSNTLDLDMVTSMMIAEGDRVDFENKRDGIDGTCKRMEFNFESKTTILDQDASVNQMETGRRNATD